jgi:hypothetical protein
MRGHADGLAHRSAGRRLAARVRQFDRRHGVQGLQPVLLATRDAVQPLGQARAGGRAGNGQHHARLQAAHARQALDAGAAAQLQLAADGRHAQRVAFDASTVPGAAPLSGRPPWPSAPARRRRRPPPWRGERIGVLAEVQRAHQGRQFVRGAREVQRAERRRALVAAEVAALALLRRQHAVHRARGPARSA